MTNNKDERYHRKYKNDSTITIKNAKMDDHPKTPIKPMIKHTSITNNLKPWILSAIRQYISINIQVSPTIQNQGSDRQSDNIYRLTTTLSGENFI